MIKLLIYEKSRIDIYEPKWTHGVIYDYLMDTFILFIAVVPRSDFFTHYTLAKKQQKQKKKRQT